MKIPEVQHFPAEGFDNKLVDLMDIRKVYFHGLFERSVVLSDGTERTYKAYVPSNAHYGDDSTYVAVPDGVDTAAFLAESGWLDEAEKEENPYILFAFEPANQIWGDADTELEYVTKAFDDMNNKVGGGFRNLVFISDFNWRWAGYGKGGEMVMRYLLRNPMMAASAAICSDLKGITEEELSAAGFACFTNSRGFTYTEWPNQKIPLPMWLMNCENNAAVDYWKVANECTGETIELADGMLYLQNPQSSNLMTFDQKVGRVMVTGAASAEKMNAFLMKYSRCGMNSPYGNMLYPTTPDRFFTRDTIISDGVEREWYVHVPSSYDPAKPMPMVIYFHGHGQGGLIAMRQGGWWQYGEEKGFITVCPSGCLHLSEKNELPLIAWHTGLMNLRSNENPDRIWENDEDRWIEYRFVAAMLEKLYGQYNIDKSRMYITGQSNGCAMTQMMSEMMSEVFTAAASTGMPQLIAHTPLPDFIMGGEFDLYPVTLTEDNGMNPKAIEDRFAVALECKDVGYAEGGRFRNGIFDNLEWQDASGKPIYRFCVVLGQAHSWRQNVCKMFWDEWFCRYSRDPETGKILYMGK